MSIQVIYFEVEFLYNKCICQGVHILLLLIHMKKNPHKCLIYNSRFNCHRVGVTVGSCTLSLCWYRCRYLYTVTVLVSLYILVHCHCVGVTVDTCTLSL